MTTFIQYSIDAISLATFYAILALGIAVLFGIMRLINFAHGELIMIGGYAIVYLEGPAWPLLLIFTMVVVIACAIAMERVAFRPVRNADAGTLLVTSFAVSYVLQNAALLVEGARPKSVSMAPFLSESVEVGEFSLSKLDIFSSCLCIGLLVTLGAFFKRTRLGVQMRAAAEDFEMARLSGVRANAVIVVAFVLSGALAGTAAFLIVAKTGTVSPTMGTAPIVVAFVATVVGGLGSLSGAALGGALLGVVSVALQALLPLTLRPFRDAFVYGVVLALLVFRPEGLRVSSARRTRV